MAKKKKTWLILGAVALGIALVAAAVWLFSGEKVDPGRVSPESQPTYPQAATAEAVVRTVTQWYHAVGTVIPRTQASIEPQVAAQVTEVLVQAGESVAKGDLLVRLEDDRLQAKLSQAQQSLQSAIAQREQARQAVNSAQAAFAEAQSAYQRVKKFYDAKAATEQELEQVQSRFLQAKASLQRAEEGQAGASAGIRLARDMVREARIALRYTEIVAPAEGEVLKRLVDPGDMAMPGKPLLLLRTAGGLQLEANIREGLVNKVRPGDTRQVRLSALDKTVDAVIEEINPFIDPQTRTFLVKADLPDVEGTYPGMFGKLMIPYMQRPVILIPPQAVQRVGQLELVTVKTPEGWRRRYIKTGETYDGLMEVLSGLNGGEMLLLEEPAENGD